MTQRHAPEPRPGFAEVFTQMPTAYLVLDLDLRVVAVNEAFERILGRRAEDLVDRDVSEVYPRTTESLDEMGRDPLRLSFERARDSGRPDQMPLFDHDVPDPATGAARRRYWSLINSPVLDGSGRTTAILQRVEDVTDYVLEHGDPPTGQQQARREQGGLGELGEADVFARAHELQAALEAQATATRRLAGLAGAALQLAAAESLEDLEEKVLAAGLTALGADGGAIGVRDDERGVVRLSTTDSLGPHTQRRYAELQLGDELPSAWAARTGQPVLLPDRAAGLAWSESMAGVYESTGRDAWAVMPLLAGNRLLGSLTASWSRPHAFGPDEVELLAAFAAQCAQTLDRLQVLEAEKRAAEASRKMSEALQRSLLSEPPTPEHLDIAVRYRPASDEAQIGGDWYDAFLTETGDTMLVVGDVTGHDRNAAAAMAQIRNVLRGVAQSVVDSPAKVLSALDRTLHNLQVDTLATAVLAQVRQDEDGTGRRVLHWSSAGHPPPLLLLADGSVELLETEPDVLLGLHPGAPRVDHEVRLPAGATVLLYTDGLVERRGEALDDGFSRLVATARSLTDLPVEQLCDAVLAELEDDLEDDVALLALSVQPDPLDLDRARTRSLVLSARPNAVRQARAVVEQVCAEAGVDAGTVDEAVLLTSETVTNAFVHARSEARLRVRADPVVVRVEVEDDSPDPPRPARHDDEALGGRGLEIVELLARRWGVQARPRGKTVWFEVSSTPLGA